MFLVEENTMREIDQLLAILIKEGRIMGYQKVHAIGLRARLENQLNWKRVNLEAPRTNDTR